MKAEALEEAAKGMRCDPLAAAAPVAPGLVLVSCQVSDQRRRVNFVDLTAAEYVANVKKELFELHLVLQSTCEWNDGSTRRVVGLAVCCARGRTGLARVMPFPRLALDPRPRNG